MIDIDKQVGYWQSGAREDWTVARELVDAGRVRHGLFLAHLARAERVFEWLMTQ